MWSADVSRMGELSERLADLASVPSRVSARVSEELGDLMQAEFDSGRDPYGTPWAHLAPATEDRGRSAPPLTDTGAMRDSLRVAPLPRAGVGITIDHPAAPHQTGWSGKQGSGPARPILPERAELPDAWVQVIAAACEDEFGKAGAR